MARGVRKRKGAYHHGDLRRALVDAALEFLEKHDARDLSLREIARVAGVSTGAPYHHFEDKDALLAAVATQAFHALADSLAASQRSTDPHERLQQLCAAYASFAVAHPTRFRVMWQVEGADRSPELLAAKQATLGQLLAAVAGVGPGVDDAPLAVWASVHGLSLLWLDGRIPRVFPGRSEAELAKRIVQLLIVGIRSASRSR